MRKYFYSIFFIFLMHVTACAYDKENPGLQAMLHEFVEGYKSLNVPPLQFDYTDYFNHIPQIPELQNQKLFFEKQNTKLRKIAVDNLTVVEKIQYNHLKYEIDCNLNRIELEIQWVNAGRKIPQNGLYALPNHSAWYSFFVQRYTSLQLSAEEVMAMGKREVARVQKEIKRIKTQTGITDSASYLNQPGNFIYLREQILAAFEHADSAIRSNLPQFLGELTIPPVYAMEWPNAGASTPPGIYLNADDNPYGKDVFQYNFYQSRFNKGAIDWLFMHEAIPGHHLQASLRNKERVDELQELFSYPGNFEGWGCYVEYYGKELGVYRDAYSELGKWQWDLVRSVRLVLDAGIHNYGWTYEQAYKYWKENATENEDIANREITRVTNWTAQALSYKVGADAIERLKILIKKEVGGVFDVKKFHRTYLSFGMRPLKVIEENFVAFYKMN